MLSQNNAIALLLLVSSLNTWVPVYAAAPAAEAGSEGKKAHDSKFQSETDAAQYRAVVRLQNIAAAITARGSYTQKPTLAAATSITRIQGANTKSTFPFAHVYSQEDPNTLITQYRAIIDKILPLDLEPKRLSHDQNIKFALWTHQQLVTVSGNKADTGHNLHKVNGIDTIHFWDEEGKQVKEIPFKFPHELS